MMECELQAFPVEILALFLISNGFFHEIWKVADIKVLQAIEKMAKRSGDGLKVCQGRLKK